MTLEDETTHNTVAKRQSYKILNDIVYMQLQPFHNKLRNIRMKQDVTNGK